MTETSRKGVAGEAEARAEAALGRGYGWRGERRKGFGRKGFGRKGLGRKEVGARGRRRGDRLRVGAGARAKHGVVIAASCEEDLGGEVLWKKASGNGWAGG